MFGTDPRETIVHSFECNPFAIGICKKQYEKMHDEHKRRIVPVYKAVTSYTGSCWFHPIDHKKCDNIGGSSLSENIYEHSTDIYSDIISVPCTTLEDYCNESNIEVVDFIKVDIEGHDLEAVLSLKDRLKYLKAIYMEVQIVPIYKDCPLYPEVKETLGDLGFVERIRPNSETHDNCLFARMS